MFYYSYQNNDLANSCKICYNKNVNKLKKVEVNEMTIFTDENFTGYEFRCTASNANVGYKHVCEVYKDNTIIPKCTATVTWG